MQSNILIPLKEKEQRRINQFRFHKVVVGTPMVQESAIKWVTKPKTFTLLNHYLGHCEGNFLGKDMCI